MHQKKFSSNKNKKHKQIWILKTLIISIFVLCLTLIHSCHNSIYAQSASVTVEVLPISVELPTTGEETKTLVVVRNSSTDTLRNIRLNLFSDVEELTITGNKLSIEKLLPGGEFVYTLQLSQSEKELVLGKVYLQLDYTVQTKRNRQSISKVVTKTFEVKSREIRKADEVVNVEVKTTLETLNENRSALAYLSITNQVDIPIRVVQVSPSGPNFVSFEQSHTNSVLQQEVPTNPNFIQRLGNFITSAGSNISDTSRNNPILINQTLLPHTTYFVPFIIKVKQKVKPGKHVLLFDVQFQWQQDGKKQTGNIIKDKEVEIGVFGESTIRELLQIPSLFVLPGFLVLMTIRQLWIWGLFRAEDQTAEFSPKPTDPEFWFFGIALSLGIALLYPLMFRQNYLEEYGLGDIFSIWLFSMILGGIGYLSWMIGRNCYKQWKTPNPKDDPIAVLKKIRRLRLSPWLDLVSLEGANPYGLLVAPPGSELNGLYWVIPHIFVQYIYDVNNPPQPQELWRQRLSRKPIVVDPQQLINERSELIKEVEQERMRKERGSADKLAALLQKGQKRGFLELRWEELEWIKRPTQFEGQRLKHAIQSGAEPQPISDSVIGYV